MMSTDYRIVSCGGKYFKCCRYCKPPKRRPACQDHCPEYKEAREQYDRDKEAMITGRSPQYKGYKVDKEIKGGFKKK